MDMKHHPVGAYLHQCVESRRIPSAVIGVYQNEQASIAAFGYQSLTEPLQPVQANTIYDIASLTKVVATTTMVLQLLEQGAFHLKTRVSDILADFPFASITVESLLTHTSGLCADDKGYKAVHDKEELDAFIYGLPLAYPTGSKVEYTDFGYIILGNIISHFVGAIDVYASKHIFQPLGMQNTCYQPWARNLESRCAATELDAKRGLIQGVVHDGKSYLCDGISGNAGLFTNAEDLLRFARMLLLNGSAQGRQILRPATVNLLQHCYTEGLNERRTLGWYVNEPQCSFGDYASATCLFHTGFTGTSLYIDFERTLAFTLLTNRVHTTRDNRNIIDIRNTVHNLILSSI